MEVRPRKCAFKNSELELHDQASVPSIPPTRGAPTFGVLPQLGSMLRPDLWHGSVPTVRVWACHPGKWEWGSKVHAAMREPHGLV